MEEQAHGLNWLAVIVAALSTMPLGMIWYHPKVFGTVWMNSIGLKPEDAKGANMMKMMGISIVMSLILAINFARLMGYHGTEDMTIKHGLYHGAEAALYLVMPVIVTNALYELRGFKYIAINVGYWLVAICVISSILSIWR